MARHIPATWLGADKCPHDHHEPCYSCLPVVIDARRECRQQRTPLHPDLAAMLGFESGILMVERRIDLFVEDFQVLSAVTYVPDELHTDPDNDWKNVAIDTLAMTGDHTLTSAGYRTVVNGIPAGARDEKHGYPIGSELPLTFYVKPYKVWLAQRQDRERQAGLFLLVRRDRVRMEWRVRDQGFVLHKQFVTTDYD